MKTLTFRKKIVFFSYIREKCINIIETRFNNKKKH